MQRVDIWISPDACTLLSSVRSPKVGTSTLTDSSSRISLLTEIKQVARVFRAAAEAQKLGATEPHAHDNEQDTHHHSIIARSYRESQSLGRTNGSLSLSVV